DLSLDAQSLTTSPAYPFAASFFLTPPPPTELYTLSLTTLFRSTGALYAVDRVGVFTPKMLATDELGPGELGFLTASIKQVRDTRDRKSTRLNSSHVKISYAVFCLKKKKKKPPLDRYLTSPTSSS